MSETKGMHLGSGLMFEAEGDQVGIDLSLWRDELSSNHLAAIENATRTMRRTVAECCIIDDGRLVLWMKVKVASIETLLRALLPDIRRMLPALA